MAAEERVTEGIQQYIRYVDPNVRTLYYPNDEAPAAAHAVTPPQTSWWDPLVWLCHGIQEVIRIMFPPSFVIGALFAVLVMVWWIVIPLLRSRNTWRERAQTNTKHLHEMGQVQARLERQLVELMESDAARTPGEVNRVLAVISRHLTATVHEIRTRPATPAPAKKTASQNFSFRTVDEWENWP
jgi:signal transduction histidine kinase